MPPARRALLIDDEPLARLELRRLLQVHPEVAIAGEAGTLNEARELLGRASYDLVFLDVQLRGGSGFDLLDSIVPEAEVIFVTAYGRYAVRAFEVNALDYLLKPVTAPRLAAALRRQTEARAQPTAPPVAPAGGRLTLDDRVYLKTDRATRLAGVASIAAIRSCENYTEVLLEDGARLLVLRALKTWEEMLPEAAFVRVHRQAIVNLGQVRAIVRAGDDEVSFQLALPGVAIPASRRQLAELRHRFTAAGLEGLLP
jgi:DNA-binding LytR/AlgR family response regulator